MDNQSKKNVKINLENYQEKSNKTIVSNGFNESNRSNKSNKTIESVTFKSVKPEYTTINTNRAVNNFIKDYFENEDIIGNNFNDISYKFLDIVDKMDVSNLTFPSK